MKNSIEDIITNSLFYIEQLNCRCCNGDVDFYLDNKKPRCVTCDDVLTVKYIDLLPVGLLPERAPILRYTALIGGKS